MIKGMDQESFIRVGEFKSHIDAWQTRMHSFLHLPLPLPWMGVGIFLFGIGYLVFLRYNESQLGLSYYGILSLIIACAGNAAVYLETILDEVADNYPLLLNEDCEQISEWLNKWYRTIFWSPKNVIAGIVGGIVIIKMATLVVPIMYDSTAGALYAYFLDFLVGVTSGSFAWMMFGVARLTSSLGKEINIKPSIFDTNVSPLRVASSLMWKVSLLGVVLYVLGLSVIYITPIPPDKFNYAVIVATGAGIMFYFIVPQLNIHKTLKNLKQGQMNRLVTQIDSSFSSVAADPKPENIQRLKDLFELQKILNRKRSWSISAIELLTLLGTILVPLFLFWLNHFFQKK